MLSDGHLRNPNTYRIGKGIRANGNKRLEFTFKGDSTDSSFAKWVKIDILGTLCTNTNLTPYPKNNPTQYWFCSRNLPYFSEIYDSWYSVHFVTGKRVKILPAHNINSALYQEFTGICLAFFIIGDGYWDTSEKTIFLCTENFTEKEVITIISILSEKLGLLATKLKRVSNYRIRFSGKQENLSVLRKLVSPYFHSSMLYKLGIK
jgi:hypothetical protein